jgi:hypothetical protein
MGFGVAHFALLAAVGAVLTGVALHFVQPPHDFRMYNFSAGPSSMPLDVLLEAQSEFLDYHGTGMAIFEQSHRCGCVGWDGCMQWGWVLPPPFPPQMGWGAEHGGSSHPPVFPAWGRDMPPSLGGGGGSLPRIGTAPPVANVWPARPMCCAACGVCLCVCTCA